MPCEVLLTSHLQATSVVVTSTLSLPSFHEDIIGMPLPTAYVPSILSSFTDEMTFFQRLRNLIFRVVRNLMTHFVFYRPFSHVQQKHNISIHKTVAEMYSDAALWLCHIDLTLDWARPVTPNWIPIGGITARPAERLPPELEEFVQGSGDDGVIVFTLGAAAHALYNEELAEIFASVFGRLPQRILWRQDGPRPKNLANNTKLVKWLPQNDLLGHPKTRLLIYHGGSNGVHEAIYHAVPMVIIPFLNDQFPLGAAIQGKGIGLVLQKYDITEKRLESTINTVLTNPRFQKRVEHLSAIHHDSPQTPRERAVFWIEHILRFGGDHLRPRAADMSFIELYMIDVAVFLTILCAFILYIEYFFLKKCLVYSNCIKSKPKRKTD
ncbi:UDP-glucuronosyltransferase 2C1 [Holothuria leucospilota]|uniref:UDP-glucuronosyltransferase 2C1 n=1 Tax=Holothuria leucospilota TaxID=206669 RepID=A0A9Q1BCZ6_HOLLE|nr:UDP-glucuronosyltransferase 2C1 [Holothuria leucospilota]